MTTRGPTVCLAELGEESIQKQLCNFPHKTCSAVITQFFKVSLKILDLLVVAVIEMNNIVLLLVFSNYISILRLETTVNTFYKILYTFYKKNKTL